MSVILDNVIDAAPHRLRIGRHDASRRFFLTKINERAEILADDGTFGTKCEVIAHIGRNGLVEIVVDKCTDKLFTLFAIHPISDGRQTSCISGQLID